MYDERKQIFKKAYNAYLKEEQKIINKNVEVDAQGVDKSFLAYILYVVNHNKKTYEKKIINFMNIIKICFIYLKII
jgi:hypothetical protein